MRSHVACVLLVLAPVCHGQTQETDDLQNRVRQLEKEVSELKQIVKAFEAHEISSSGASLSVTMPQPAAGPPLESTEPPVGTQLTSTVTTDDRKALNFWHGTTLNLGLDTYYGYNFPWV